MGDWVDGLLFVEIAGFGIAPDFVCRNDTPVHCHIDAVRQHLDSGQCRTEMKQGVGPAQRKGQKCPVKDNGLRYFPRSQIQCRADNGVDPVGDQDLFAGGTIPSSGKRR